MSLSDFVTEIFPVSPYEGFDPTPYQLDLQGWQSRRPVFQRIIDEIRPGLIIEVGTWKGASAIHMAGLAKAHRPDCRVLCIDTWTASNLALWVNPKFRAMVNLRHGFPDVYWRFLANVVLSGHRDTILPLPVTGSCGAEILHHFGIVADLIYIDAGHQESEVAADLRAFWPLLRPGGYMLGDDYSDGWPGVCRAVLKFCAEHELRLGSNQEKWFVRKPVRGNTPPNHGPKAAPDRRENASFADRT
jgi:hypothetical protein